MNMNMLRSIGNSLTSVESAPKREKSNDIHKRGYTGPLYIVRICSLN